MISLLKQSLGKYSVDIRYAPKENCGIVSLGYPRIQLHNQCKKETT